MIWLAPVCPLCTTCLSETTKAPELPFFSPRPEGDAEGFFSKETFEKLPARSKKAAQDALELYRFFERKEASPNFSPVFSALLGPFDEASKEIIFRLLRDNVPANRHEQENWFDPYLEGADRHSRNHYEKMAKNLKRGLVYGNPHSVLGLLCSCFDYALNDRNKLDGVFEAVRETFRLPGSRRLLERVRAVNDFRTPMSRILKKS